MKDSKDGRGGMIVVAIVELAIILTFLAGILWIGYLINK